MKSPELTVVVPAFNEARRIEATLQRIVDYLGMRGTTFEIVVVDDGSNDGTADLVTTAAARLSSGTGRIGLLENGLNRGKGYSVRRGMLAAHGRRALLCDADLSAPIEEYEKLDSAVKNGPCDIAMGSRDIEGARVEVHQSVVREQSGKLYNLMVRTLFRLPFRDTQCGFKLFDLSRCRDIFNHQTIEGFGFDVELLTIATRMGYRIREVPVVWRHDPGSKVHFFRDGARMVLDLFRIRWNTAKGRYGRRANSMGADRGGPSASQ